MSTFNPPQDDVEQKTKPILTRKKRSSPINVFRALVRGNSKKSSVPLVDDESKNVWSKLIGSIRPLHLQGSQSLRSSSSRKFNQVTTLQPYSRSQSISSASVFTTEEEPFLPSPESTSHSCYASAIGLNELVENNDDNARYASPIGSNELVENNDDNARFASPIGLNELVENNDDNACYASPIGLNELVENNDENARYASPIGLNELVENNDDNAHYTSAIALNELDSSDEENEEQEVIKEDHGDDKIDDKAEEFIAQFYQQMRLQRLNTVDLDYQERSERSLGWY